MRFIFKTDYDQDIKLFKHAGAKFWYAVLLAVAIAAPAVLGKYYISQLSFICIYSIAGVGLMLLSGYAGQISIGHAAFLAVGGYTEAIAVKMGLPFPLSLILSFIVAGLIGIIIGLPAIRIKGIYLAIATLAFNFLVEEVLVRWSSVTGGNNGLMLDHAKLFGVAFKSTDSFYYLSLAILVIVILGVLNLLRSSTGRSFVAIRDSQISAQSMGVDLAKYKTMAFGLSAGITGIAGALYAYKIRFISPEQFGVMVSIELLMMIVIGGIGSLHGAVFGAIFFISLPELIALVKNYLPEAIANQTGLQPTIFGFILICVVIFEPEGIYAWWIKMRSYFEMFPFYRKTTFKRTKTFMKSDRLS